jgi:hypothetical protein
MVFGMPHAFKESSILWTGLFALLALALSYPAASLLYRFFPLVFGTRAVTYWTNNQMARQRISAYRESE